jgi:hypothetical protein
VSAVAYPAEGHLLFVEFRQIGEVYLYFDVSREEFLQLLRADSNGGYFNRQIRDRFHYLAGLYRHRQVNGMASF